MKRVILVSGGIDSFCAWSHYDRYAGSNNIPVFIDYGQAYRDKELFACKMLFDDLSILTLGHVSGIQAKDNPFVPCRNLAFASSIAMSFEPNEIVMGGLRDDNVVDKSLEAFIEMSAIISKHSNNIVNVTSPFWQMSKGEVIHQYLKEGGDVDVLLKCVSCYESCIGHCNDCPACFRRFVALASNGIPCGRPSNRMINLYLKKIHSYDLDRQSRTFIALKSIGYKVIAIDIDGTLTNETGGCRYEDRTPNLEAIADCKKLYLERDDAIIVLYTSRLESDRFTTDQWLKTYSIKYHSLIMNKLPFDFIVDDLSKNLNELIIL
jgi:7-cyano-7-deazaguanine synthase in queuosine biosynthesis